MQGLSYLGLGASKQFQDIVIREHPAGWGARAFTQKEIFGPPEKCLQGLIDSGRCPLVGLNLMWKDKRGGVPTYGAGDLGTLEREAKRWKNFVTRNSSTIFHVSGATEHGLNSGLANKFREVAISALGAGNNLVYVNQPYGSGALLSPSNVVLNERHGKEAMRKPLSGPYSFDFDGTDAFDIDVEAYKAKFAGATVFWWWTSQFNLKFNADDKTARPDRRAIPTPQLIDALIYLQTHTQGAVKMPPKFLNKPKADQHKVPPENRALKPVMIIPVNGRRIELVADNGQVVEVSTGKDKFNDGRMRYYFESRYGFQITEKAYRIQGHPVLKVRVDGKFYGTVNMAFRQGEFR